MSPVYFDLMFQHAIRSLYLNMKQGSCLGPSLYFFSDIILLEQVSIPVNRNVIQALAEGNRSHVPFRNSTLTRLLQEGLSGNCKTRLVVSTNSDNLSSWSCFTKVRSAV